jgi:lipopolysaccharide biosynthesis regulator YciM
LPRFRRVAATALLFTFLLACGKKPDQLVSDAEQLLAQGKQEEAVLLLRKVLQTEPDHARANYKLGLIAQKEDRMFEAAEHFRVAAREAKPEYLISLARVLLQAYLSIPSSGTLRQQVEDAGKQLRAAAGGAGNQGDLYAEAERLEGYLSVMDQRGEDAIRHFRAAFNAKPEMADVQLSLVQQLLAAGQREAAKEELDRKPSAPLFETIYLETLATQGCNAALSFLQAKQPVLGEDEFSAKLRTAEHRRRCEGRAAQDALLAELQNQPNLTRSQALKLGDFYAAENRWPAALEFYEKAQSLPAASRQEEDGSIELRRSSALIALNRFAEAATLLDKYLEAFPNDAAALGQRGLLRLNSDLPGIEASSGIEDLRRALAADRANMPQLLRVQLIAGLMRLGQIPEARRELQYFDNDFPSALAARLLKAELELRLGRFEVAENMAKEILVQAPGLREARVIQALSLAGMGQSVAAANILRALQGESPLDDALAAQLIVVLLDANTPAARVEAQNLRTKLQSRPTNSVATRFLLAEIDLRLGNRNAAIESLSELVRRNVDPRAAVRLAELRLAGGDSELGCQELRALSDRESSLAVNVRASWWGLEGICRGLENKPAAAIEAHRKAHQFRPEDAALANNLASAIAEYETNPNNEKDLIDALRLAEAAVKASPSTMQYQDTLAWVRYRRGEIQAAADIYQQLMKQKELPAEIQNRARKVMAQIGSVTR